MSTRRAYLVQRARAESKAASVRLHVLYLAQLRLASNTSTSKAYLVEGASAESKGASVCLHALYLANLLLFFRSRLSLQVSPSSRISTYSRASSAPPNRLPYRLPSWRKDSWLGALPGIFASERHFCRARGPWDLYPINSTRDFNGRRFSDFSGLPD
jgi:hypothetical protein